MGINKPTKRERKFKASGGIERRLKKGTVAKKGKIRQRKKLAGEHSVKKDTPKADLVIQKDRSDDLTAQDNLGNLDMDSFFAHFAEKVDREMKVDGVDEEETPSNDSDAASMEGEEAMNEDETSELGEDINGDDKDSHASDSESDDDDVDAAEARMRKNMAGLQEQDPEFHKFLKSNERSLLDFGDESNSSVEGSDDEASEEEQRPQSKIDAVELNAETLASLEKGTFHSHGIKSFKKLVAAFKSACHMGDTNQEAGWNKPGESGKNFVIESSQVFDQLMLLCLNRCHEAFQYHLLGDEGQASEEDGVVALQDNTPINPRTLENSKSWSAVRPILLSFMRSILHLLSEAKEPEQLVLILDALSKYVRLLSVLPRVAAALLKSCTMLWSGASDDEDYQLVRIKAFVRIRQLALTQPFPFIEECLKKCYLAYAKRAKFGGSASVATELPTLTFMGNCLVELYSLDFDSSYQHAFVYIRQLALLLRAALQKKTPEALQQVYCWQYIFCLKLWVAVLSAAAPQEDGSLMRSLIYPLTEIILGVIRSGHSPTRYLPLRFHCIRALQQLASASETYIPTALLLMKILNLKEWHMKTIKSRSSETRGLQMNLLIRLPKDDCLRTHEQLEAAATEVFALIERELELYRYSPGFPEFSIQVVQSLKKFVKATRSPRWKTFARACLDTCNRYSTFAVNGRSKLRESPKDVQRLESLRPASEPNMLERLNASIEKERKQWDAAVVSQNGKRKKGRNNDTGDDSASEEEEKPKKKKTKKNKRGADPTQRAPVDDSLDLSAEQDEVKEGIDWSDEE